MLPYGFEGVQQHEGNFDEFGVNLDLPTATLMNNDLATPLPPLVEDQYNEFGITTTQAMNINQPVMTPSSPWISTPNNLQQLQQPPQTPQQQYQQIYQQQPYQQQQSYQPQQQPQQPYQYQQPQPQQQRSQQSYFTPNPPQMTPDDIITTDSSAEEEEWTIPNQIVPNGFIPENTYAAATDYSYQDQLTYMQPPPQHYQPLDSQPQLMDYQPSLQLSYPNSNQTMQQPQQFQSPPSYSQSPQQQPRQYQFITQSQSQQAGPLPPSTTPSKSAPLDASQTKPHPPVAKKACIHCRKLKASCDNDRPCGRCVKFHRDCIDRTPEEVAAAKARRKRSINPTTTPAATNLPTGAAAAATAPSSNKVESMVKTTQPTQVKLEPGTLTNNHTNRSPHPAMPNNPNHTTSLTVVTTVKPNKKRTSEAVCPPQMPTQIATASKTTSDTNMTTSIPPSIADPSTYSLSTSATEKVAIQLYSRSLLSVLVQMDVRNMILTFHSQLETLPLPISTLLHWHTQVTMCMLQMLDQLTPEDLTFWLTDGLTPAQLDSPIFQHSPLAPWLRLSTRPLHYAIQPTPASFGPPPEEDFVATMSRGGSSDACSSSSSEAGGGGGGSVRSEINSSPNSQVSTPNPSPPTQINRLPSSRSSMSSSSTPQLKIQWLPQSHLAFQRWQRMLGQKIKYERQLRASRGVNPIISDDVIENHSKDRTSLQSQLEMAQLSAEGKFMNEPSGPTELDQLIDNLACLDVGRSLACAAPLMEKEEDRVINTHAVWCPLGHPSIAWNPDETKKKQKATPTSPSDLIASTADGNSCLCELSTALPTKIRVNSAFERVFGYSQRDVERGIAVDGFRFFRKFSPPSAWPLILRQTLLHWTTLIQFVANMSIHSAYVAMKAAHPERAIVVPEVPLPVAAIAPPLPDQQPDPFASSAASVQSEAAADSIPTQILTRSGMIRPCQLKKCVHVQQTEESREASACIISWDVQE